MSVAAIVLIVVVGCSRREPIAFDSSNDWHCVLAFEQTTQAVREGGDEELAESMAFRARWAEAQARDAGVPEPNTGQKASLRDYLESGAREGAESSIACRRRQNQDPSFPKNQIL